MFLPGKYYSTPLKRLCTYLEEIFIESLKPSLNEQKNLERLILLRNGIT